jgi:hypothetical protein
MNRMRGYQLPVSAAVTIFFIFRNALAYQKRNNLRRWTPREEHHRHPDVDLRRLHHVFDLANLEHFKLRFHVRFCAVLSTKSPLRFTLS